MTGLRERNKARTRAKIQRHALLLFRSKGFQATTVEQVAAAAEVSPSTAFRYFPTKEALLVLDDHLSLADAVVRAFEEQPPHVSPSQALRVALGRAYAALSPEDLAARRERDELMLQIPEVWSANIVALRGALATVGEAVAARAGRSPADAAVRTYTGAVLGISVQVFLDSAADPRLDPAQMLDQALDLLDRGLPL